MITSVMQDNSVMKRPKAKKKYRTVPKDVIVTKVLEFLGTNKKTVMTA
jgi:hypothetical protein